MELNASTTIITETVSGIVNRVTYHNESTGWSVLRVQPFNHPQQITVIVHQIKVFAGATMEFTGNWFTHSKHGLQFKASAAIEKKPATSAALEKYLGSGLIKGVGPKTARKIVNHFKKETLDVFENNIGLLTEVPGIAQKKLSTISQAWVEHKSIREVMMFLQSHGISTLFAVKIFKEYGEEAISNVTEDPYRLAGDFYGIGFFSADKVALSLGFETDSPKRIVAGIRHVLAASREHGHCYLTRSQIRTQVEELLSLDLDGQLSDLLTRMEKERQLMVRETAREDEPPEACYYARSLYFDELYVARKIRSLNVSSHMDMERVSSWVTRYCSAKGISLSDEQAEAVKGIVSRKVSVLTGGPGCGKTTTTLVLVKLLEAMRMRVILAAPTGRAAQRMSEVIGRESKTIHRLLGWQGSGFKKNEDTPLDADFLIVDECSMLDISLTASLLKAVPAHCHVLFIGDANQLPSVGAGNVIKDIIASSTVACFTLTKIFRQAQGSQIIRYAHQINDGKTPYIDSPFNKPELWQNRTDCLFIDSEEATREQIHFINKVKRHFDLKKEDRDPSELYEFRGGDALSTPYESEINIPKKFQHVDLDAVCRAKTRSDELISVLKKIHPWSSLHYGLSAAEVVCQLYLRWIPKYLGRNCEIQILSPMTRGSLGTANLNRLIQNAVNPFAPEKPQIKVGDRIFREGDRVIHRRNNYDLGVFNGDIGRIEKIDSLELTWTISFFPDNRKVLYKKEHIVELDLAYAITIHKSQGSEFEAVILPVLTQHFKMLYRNLIYTGLTRAKKMAVLVGSRRALTLSVKNQDTSLRQTALRELLEEG